MLRFLLALSLVLSASLAACPAAAQYVNRPARGVVRVRIETDMGNITVALDQRRAPATTANFLAYVDDGRFDGTSFYRAARRKTDPKLGFVQGGIRTDARRILPPFAQEPTSRTGILHLDGTISMARRDGPSSAGGNYFITIGPMPSMDARGSYPGYAAFGRVVAGRDVLTRILAAPTCCGEGPMRGQMIRREVTVKRMVRLDGTPKPTGRVKTWMIVPRR